jgi:hypothetical protein
VLIPQGHQPHQFLKKCDLVSTPSRHGLPAADQPELTDPSVPWDGLVLTADPQAGRFDVVTAKLDPEATAILQKQIATKLASAMTHGTFIELAEATFDQYNYDLSRANGIAYEVPAANPQIAPKEDKGILARVADYITGGQQERQPQAWLLVDGEPIIDHDLRERNLPPRSTL